MSAQHIADNAIQVLSEATYDAGFVLATMAHIEQIEQDPDSDSPSALAAIADATALFSDPREADRLNGALAYLEALQEMTAKEITRQQARHRAIESAAYQIQRDIITAMESAQQTAIHGQHCTLQLRRNPPSVRIETPGLIPAEYMRTPPPPAAIPDKIAIRAAIEADIFVPGCALVRSTKLVRK